MSRISNRREKDKKRRAKLRKRLRDQGVNEQEIERIIDQQRAYDRAMRGGWEPGPTRDEILANTDDSLWPDDTSYRPRTIDPLLNGVARATGATARVVKRRETVTEYQYDRLVGGDS